MVPKAGYLARSVISKSITHGYIQSVVAASQSSYAAHHNNFGHLGARLGKSQNLHTQQHAFVDRNQHSNHAASKESSLAACITAWQKAQGVGQKWEQFQFAKRIEWKPQTLLAESKDAKDDVKDGAKESSVEETDAPSAPRLDRSYSTSAVDDLRKATTPEEAAEVLEQAIASETSRTQQDAGA